jgi:hypothetical protein
MSELNTTAAFSSALLSSVIGFGLAFYIANKLNTAMTSKPQKALVYASMGSFGLGLTGVLNQLIGFPLQGLSINGDKVVQYVVANILIFPIIFLAIAYFLRNRLRTIGEFQKADSDNTNVYNCNPINSLQIKEILSNGHQQIQELNSLTRMLNGIGFIPQFGIGILCIILSFAVLEELGFLSFILSISLSFISLSTIYAVSSLQIRTTKSLTLILESNLAMLASSFEEREVNRPANNKYPTSYPQTKAVKKEESHNYDTPNKNDLAVPEIQSVNLIESLSDAKNYCSKCGYILTNKGTNFTIIANNLTHFFYSENELTTWCKRDFERTKPTPQQPS